MKIVNSVKSFLVYLFGTSLYLGYFPFASGTVSSLLPAFLFYFFQINDSLILVSLPILYLIGFYTANEIKKVHGNDPYIVTIDEFIGFCITMLFLPKTFFYLTVGFLLFRLFDIVKPYPANIFDKKETANGILLDDVFAGIYANLVLQIIKFFFIR